MEVEILIITIYMKSFLRSHDELILEVCHQNIKKNIIQRTPNQLRRIRRIEDVSKVIVKNDSKL